MSEEVVALTKEQIVATAISRLDARELSAYKYFINAHYPELGQELSQKFYVLFESGASCEEIRKANPGISLGAIVQTRVRDGWDVMRANHLEDLKRDIPDRVTKTQLDSADFLQKLLTATHLVHSEALDKFLATGDKAHLRGTPFENMKLKEYQQILELLLKVTGQDNKKVVEVKGGITVQNKGIPTIEEAANILDVLAEEIIDVPVTPMPMKKLVEAPAKKNKLPNGN